MLKNKITIRERVVEGNLKSTKQVYRFNFIPQFENLPAKLEMSVCMLNNQYDKQEYRSIRFNQPEQIKQLLFDVAKSYYFFAKQIKDINPENVNYKLTKLVKEMLESIKNG